MQMLEKWRVLSALLVVITISIMNILMAHWIPDTSSGDLLPWKISSTIDNPDQTLLTNPPLLFSPHVYPNDGFAACLLLKDDTSKLAEWLAYHWLVLPLKFLIVGVDPTGTTNPREILELWNNSNMEMEIILWNDIDYHHWINNSLDELHRHRSRQKHLYSECMKFHKDRNRTWVILIDVDEFLTYNTFSDESEDNIHIEAESLEQLSCPKKFLSDEYISSMLNIRREIPQIMEQYKYIFDYISDYQYHEPWSSEKCHLISRLFFSSIESSEDELALAQVSDAGFDTQRFSTLRYFHHADKDAFPFNNFGKVMIDLSRIERTEISRIMSSIHKPLYCSCSEPVRPYRTSVLRVHHYLGSWEQYSARPDTRRSKAVYEKFSSVDYGVNYELRSWLKQFIDIVGIEKSLLLLESAGIVLTGSIPIMDIDPAVLFKIPDTEDESVKCSYYYYETVNE